MLMNSLSPFESLLSLLKDFTTMYGSGLCLDRLCNIESALKDTILPTVLVLCLRELSAHSPTVIYMPQSPPCVIFIFNTNTLSLVH